MTRGGQSDGLGARVRPVAKTPKEAEARAIETKVWAEKVMELKASLDEQTQLASEMSESAKDPDQEQAEAFHEQYRFLVETLKAFKCELSHVLQLLRL